MSASKKWKILNKIKDQRLKIKDTEQIVKILLENRGLKTKKEIDEFLNPRLEDVTVVSVEIDKKQLDKAIERIKKAIENKEQIIVFGDYDVDGISGAAILWETLHSLGADVLPYIPHRVDEGYGLSLAGISNLKSSAKGGSASGGQISNVQLIITVDNGIVANEAVEFANKNGIDVIITDHHVPSSSLPKAYAIVHTTKLCGAGVAYMLAQEISNIKYQISNKYQIQNTKYKIQDTCLELVALATIADLVPLVGANRTLTKFGLLALKKTKRAGLLELYKEAALNAEEIGVYEVGHAIAPRLNAMGRIESAMDSLRLLCTKDPVRAKTLAFKLGSTNRERQVLTQETAIHAISNYKLLASRRSGQITNKDQGSKIQKLIFIAHETYQQGVIGLVAGKLVEEFYRPAIVVSKGEIYSKASARSVHGFNIIEFIRSAQDYLVDAGGHPMAAGFTVETAKLEILQKILEEGITTKLNGELLTRSIRIDCELDSSFITQDLYNEIQKLAPFGMGNPEPTFVSRNVVIEDMRLVGKEGKHIKLNVKCQISPARNATQSVAGGNVKFEAIAFGMGEKAQEFRIGDSIDVVYTIDENFWNGNRNLQLKIKDVKKS